MHIESNGELENRGQRAIVSNISGNCVLPPFFCALLFVIMAQYFVSFPYFNEDGMFTAFVGMMLSG